MKTARWHDWCSGILATIALTACGTGPSIKSFEHDADLSSYKTYGFYEAAAPELSSDETATDLVPKFIRAAIDREMRTRGYREGGEAADLLVNFHLQTEQKDTVSTSPAAYFGWREGYHWAANPVRDDEITTYTTGTLSVDVIDRARNELVWEGVAIGRVRNEALKHPEPAIDAVVAQIFQRYPLPAHAAQ